MFISNIFCLQGQAWFILYLHTLCLSMTWHNKDDKLSTSKTPASHNLTLLTNYLPILLRTSCPNMCALNYIIYLSSYHLQTHTLVLYLQPFIYIQHVTLHYWLPMSSKNQVFTVMTHGYQQLCVCVSPNLALFKSTLNPGRGPWEV